MEIKFQIDGLLLCLLGLIGMFCFYIFYGRINQVYKYFQNEMNQAYEISMVWRKENPVLIDKELDYGTEKVLNPTKTPDSVKDAYRKFDKMKDLRDSVSEARTLSVVLLVLCLVGTIFSLTIG